MSSILKEHIYSVLIISKSESFNSDMIRYLPQSKYYPVNIVHSINDAQREIIEHFYDFLIINSPLPDDFGIKFAIDTSNKSPSVVLFFVSSDNYNDTYDKVSDFGVFTMRKPISTQNIYQALDFMISTRERLRKMENKMVSLESKMLDIKIINRAKWALINSLNMTEDEAHRYIEKQAMDKCISRRNVADEILKTYK